MLFRSCGGQVNPRISIDVDEEKVVNDFGTVWDGQHLSRIGVSKRPETVREVAYLKIKDGVLSHAP